MPYIIICVIITICSAITTYYCINQIYKTRKEYKILKEQKQILDTEIKKDIEKVKELNKKYIEITTSIINSTKEREESILRAAEAKDMADKLLISEKKRVKAEIDKQFELESNRIEKEIKTKYDVLTMAYSEKEQALANGYAQKAADAQHMIEFIQSELKDYKEKQRAINEQLHKEQLLQNEENAHRITLSLEDKSDIEYLVSIEKNINNKELLHKLIWTEYIQRPFNQMLKNTLGLSSPKNVIYCIENIKTHKKYIGKTRGEYKDRQINHIKASLSIGTISHQEIHNALFGHWDEFAFYIIEEVKDESKLSEREKYYINFYETDKYGYNLKVG